MRRRILVVMGSLLLAAGVAGCGSRGSGGPGRDALLAQLKQEAEALKRENEGQDTSLGVKATWNVASVDVTEPAGDDAPWKGTIRFRIRSETRDGVSVAVDEFEKTFHYEFNTTLNRWVFEYKPS